MYREQIVILCKEHIWMRNLTYFSQSHKLIQINLHHLNKNKFIDLTPLHTAKPNSAEGINALNRYPIVSIESIWRFNGVEAGDLRREHNKQRQAQTVIRNAAPYHDTTPLNRWSQPPFPGSAPGTKKRWTKDSAGIPQRAAGPARRKAPAHHNRHTSKIVGRIWT